MPNESSPSLAGFGGGDRQDQALDESRAVVAPHQSRAQVGDL